MMTSAGETSDIHMHVCIAVHGGMGYYLWCWEGKREASGSPFLELSSPLSPLSPFIHLSTHPTIHRPLSPSPPQQSNQRRGDVSITDVVVMVAVWKG